MDDLHQPSETGTELDLAPPTELMQPGMTTAEKLAAVRDALFTTNPEEMPEEVRTFVAGVQMAAGMGFDILELLVPDDPSDLDIMVDRAIALLLQLRGDDLPPFDATMYSELAQ